MMKIGNRDFDTVNNTYIMGILNVTPDSFYDGGRFVGNGTSVNIDDILYTCERMIADGADIIDIGGESTRPDAPTVSADEELSRVIPAIEAVSSHFDVPISVDTYKACVATESVEAGARLINDIWGLKGDPDMPAAVSSAIKKYDNIAVCIMHNRRPNDHTVHGDDNDIIPITMHGEDIDYGYTIPGDKSRQSVEDAFIADVRADLASSIRMGLDAGISSDRIILDPGVGFAKTYEQNLTVMRRLNDLSSIADLCGHVYDYPILLGVSRKSVIGFALDKPKEGRLSGTLATTAYGMINGVSFIRVHDVAENADVVRMIHAIGGEYGRDQNRGITG